VENERDTAKSASVRHRTLNRSNIWRDRKNLCESAGAAPGKVFPHNFWHLFARTYHGLHKGIARLADILGHSNVNTTRIYTMESGAVHARQIEVLAPLYYAMTGLMVPTKPERSRIIYGVH